MHKPESFFESLRHIEKNWASALPSERKYAALKCALGVPFIFILTHIAMWLSEYLTHQPLHKMSEYNMGWDYFFLLVLIFVGCMGYMGYLEIKTRMRR